MENVPAPSLLDVQKELKAEKQKVAVLEQQLALYQKDGAIGMYYELNKMVNRTVEIMRKKNLDELAGSSEKGDKEFERVMKLVDSSIGYLDKLDALKLKLNLSGDEEKDRERKLAFVDTIADKRP